MLQAHKFYINFKKECHKWIDKTQLDQKIPNPKSRYVLQRGNPQRRSSSKVQDPKSYYLASTVFCLGLTYFLTTGLVSCSNFSFSRINTLGANVTPIRELRSQPDSNTTVYIQGKVEKIAPLWKRRAYLVRDETGKIWVITNQTNLRVGDQVVIKGKIRYRSIPIAGREYGEVYIEEK
ncbi:DNA-binding protein [Fischerella major NIES-592]|uniref:DNA-binding protein n=1 Tax=Fischerella major NIES-592 TaxID=210994 RepID=A0A1U7H6B7_9CYAN|nr:DNA-binding protein [Fischerella major]OKH16807.1 DNA-binding protein [Fischerella major NIES-592]